MEGNCREPKVHTINLIIITIRSKNMTEIMTEKTSENKGDFRMITLAEKDADLVISLLKEMQSYRQRDIETAEEKVELLKNSAGESVEKGILNNFCEILVEKTMEEYRLASEKENERFQRAILLLTAGSDSTKKKRLKNDGRRKNN